VRCDIREIIQLVLNGFWVIFIQELDSKLNRSGNTYPIDLKFSGKLHSNTTNIRPKLSCKTPSLKDIAFYTTTTELNSAQQMHKWKFEGV